MADDTGLLDESFKDGGGIPFIALEVSINPFSYHRVRLHGL